MKEVNSHPVFCSQTELWLNDGFCVVRPVCFVLFTVVTDPLGDVLQFIRTYNEKYPEHPVFYQGTYAQALTDAKRELKFLAVYLHNEANNSKVTKFCRRSLSDPNVIQYINRHMLFWACDVATPEGFRVSQSVAARNYPFIVVVGLRANRMTIMTRSEGDCPPEELLTWLKSVVDDNDVWLSKARADRSVICWATHRIVSALIVLLVDWSAV